MYINEKFQVQFSSQVTRFVITKWTIYGKKILYFVVPILGPHSHAQLVFTICICPNMAPIKGHIAPKSLAAWFATG